jgi:hypothetical protein
VASDLISAFNGEFVLAEQATKDRSTPDPAEVEIRDGSFWAWRP